MKRILLKTDQNLPEIKAYKEAVEKGKLNQHVFFLDGDWVVKRIGTNEEPKVFETQQEAIQFAEEMAKKLKTALFIHGEDGRIKERKDF